MKTKLNLLLIVFIIISCAKKEKQPVLAPKKKVIDTYFGQEVADNYRYMEDLENPEFLSWVRDKNKEINKLRQQGVTKELLDKIRGMSVDKESILETYRTKNDKYFYFKKDVKGNQPKLYYRESLSAKEELLYDPKDFKSELNNQYIINYFKPSRDGSKIVISLIESDRDISEMIIVDVASKKVLSGVLDKCWPNVLGVSWLPDDSGIVYTNFPSFDNENKSMLNSEAVLYKLGVKSDELIKLFSKKNNATIPIKKEELCVSIIDEHKGEYVFSAGLINQYADFYYAKTSELQEGNIDWKLLYTKQDLIFSYEVSGNDFIYLTAKNAGNFKICKTSFDDLDFNNPEVLVEEDPNEIITGMAVTNNGVYFVRTRNGVEASLFLLDNNNKINKIKLSEPYGSLNISSKGAGYSDLWFDSSGWLSKKQRFDFDFLSKEFKKENLGGNNLSKTLKGFIVEEIEVASHDGEKVPLSIIYKKGMKKDGDNRLLIKAYGAYGLSLLPKMSTLMTTWLEKGGVYAVAHVRGGGEKGDDWYKAGLKASKPNSWKDLNACVSFLIDNNYTHSSKVVALGASAGGICISKAITESPDFYKAAIIQVGSLNVLRHESRANGKRGVKEYGTVKDSIEFKGLYRMDAYHSINVGQNYPSVYLTGGMNDPRVSAWQPAKFAAKLQEAHLDNTVLLYTDFEGGHGFSKTEEKRNQELADILSFAFWQTGHPDYQIAE